MPLSLFVFTLTSASDQQLVEALAASACDHQVRDLVVEIGNTRGFRIVREGNAAQGVFLSRHALIGLLVCLYAPDRTSVPSSFWKEVLS